MELKYSTLFSVMSCVWVVLLFYYAWKVVNILWIRPKRVEKLLRKQGLKGNSYRFMFGDMKEMFMINTRAKSKPITFDHDIKQRIMPFFIKTLQKYGNGCFVWTGPTPTIITSEPDLIKEVMSKHYKYLKQTNPNPLTKKLVQGVVLYEGDKWAKHRKIINPAFHLEKLKLMMPAFYTSCEEILNKWERQISSQGSCEIDVWPDIENLTADVISRIAFSSNFEKGRKIFELQMEQTGHILKLLQSIYIPGWSLLPTKVNKRIKAIEKEVSSLILLMIEARMKAAETGEERTDDLLTILLESNLQEIENHGNKTHGMSINEVIEECKLFYLAGQSTTAALILWTLVLLGKYTEWQRRARDEVSTVFGNNKILEYGGLNDLKLVTMILHEVMRLYPPVISVTRRVADETKLRDLTLLAGVEILMPIIMLDHDRDIWGDDAMDFNPERFREGVSKAQMGKGMYFPFGWGPRICIGQTLAMVEAKIILAMILQRFWFELSPSYSHAPYHFVLSLVPQHGAHLVLHKI